MILTMTARYWTMTLINPLRPLRTKGIAQMSF